MRNAETSSTNDVQLIRRLEEGTGVINSVAVHGNRLVASGSGLVARRSCRRDSSRSVANEPYDSKKKNRAHRYNAERSKYLLGTSRTSCSRIKNAIAISFFEQQLQTNRVYGP